MDADVQVAIKSCERFVAHPSLRKIKSIWEMSVQIPGWTNKPEWTHGDLHNSNLLFKNKKLFAVLDFNNLQLNDPAVDLTIVWNTFGKTARNFYRQISAIDENTWLRGRAYALSKALFAIPYYQHTNPEIIERSHYTLEQILSEV